MKTRTASEVLRCHAVERFLRGHVRSVNLDGDLGAVRRMSQAEWVESCRLVVGLDEVTLDLLGLYFCASHDLCSCKPAVRQHGCPHQRWDEILVDVQGTEEPVRKEKASRGLTLGQAAARMGLVRSFAQLKAMREAAIGRIVENQVRRASSMRSAEEGQAT